MVRYETVLAVLVLSPLIPVGVWVAYRGLVNHKPDSGWRGTLRAICTMLLGGAIGGAAFALMLVS